MESINNNTNLPAIPITSVTNSIVQIPTQDNGRNAIVNSDIKTAYGSVSDFGIANPDSAGTDDTAKLIQAARDVAISRATELAGYIYQGNQAAPKIIDVTPQETVFGSASSRRAIPGKNYGGGGNKPITPGQMSFIKSLCQQKGIAPDSLCQEMFSKSLNKLTGSNANEAIQKLQSQ
jgi:hypothetical protein